MALKTKAIKGSGIVQLRSVRTSAEGDTFTEVQVYTGPYAALKTKQDANLGAKATSLEPTEANHGKLTVTWETKLPEGTNKQAQEVTTEVVWQELRKAVETNPFFSELTADEVAAVKKLADDGGPAPSEGYTSGQIKLYDLLAKGTTEWSTGVPLVRRTTTNVRGDLEGGNAWFRDAPPIAVAGGWEFLKTADERRRVGKSYTQTEEWTGAEEWDEDLYPTAP